MYARYNWAASTPIDVALAHVIQLITGARTTSTSLLLNPNNEFCTSLNYAATYHAPGWEIHDYMGQGTTALTSCKGDVAGTAFTQLATWTMTGGAIAESLVPECALWISSVRSGGTSTIKMFKTKAGRDADTASDVICSYSGSGTGTQTLASQNGSGVTFSVAITTGDYPLELGCLLSTGITIKSANDVGYTYVKINTSASSFTFQLLETWSNTTHSGSNQCVSGNANTSSVVVSGVGGLYIFASINGLVFSPTTASTAQSSFMSILKRSRTLPYDALTGSYLPVACHFSGSYGASPRQLTSTGADLSGGASYMQLHTCWYYTGGNNTAVTNKGAGAFTNVAQPIGEGKAYKYALSPLYMVGVNSSTYLAGDCLFDMFAIGTAGTHGDELLHDSVPHVVINHGTQKYAIRKG